VIDQTDPTTLVAGSLLVPEPSERQAAAPTPPVDETSKKQCPWWANSSWINKG
jgi:hypothetical protein